MVKVSILPSIGSLRGKQFVMYSKEQETCIKKKKKKKKKTDNLHADNREFTV
ncbi:hypothetical protein C0J52_07731 [Blattella germanica]|nr:hypothetical protein C0J52_07731 [Blattella germanica]